MEIKITVEKKYVWFLFLTVAAVGLVVAYGTTNPPVMGHSVGEIEDMVVNCKENDPICAGPKSSSWNLKAVAAWAANAWSAERFQGRGLGDFCLKDGTNCPPKATFTQCTEKMNSGYYAEARCASDETFLGGSCTGGPSSFGVVYDAGNKKVIGWQCTKAGGGEPATAKAICCK